MKEIKIKTHKYYRITGSSITDEQGVVQEFKNKSKMAKHLGISRQALYTKLKEGTNLHQ